MDNFDKRWATYPNIGFELNRIMTVDKHTVEIPDITGETLYEYIDKGRERIDTQLGVIGNMRRYRGGSEANPHILVGRLALSGFEDRALTTEGLEVSNDLHITEKDLLVEYQEFWHAIDHALYKPVIHRDVLASYPSLNGIWLGLSRHR